MVSKFVCAFLVCSALSGCCAYTVHDARMSDMIQRMLEHEFEQERLAGRSSPWIGEHRRYQ